MNWEVNIPLQDTSWLSIINKNSGTNFDSVFIKTEFNPGVDRYGSLAILAHGAVHSPDTVYINQGNYLPDLKIKIMAFEPSAVERGGKVNISGQYQNIGNGPSTNSRIGFYLSQDNVFNPADDRWVGYAIICRYRIKL